MVLDEQRKNIDPLIQVFARMFSGFHPNALTWISFLFAPVAGLLFYLSNQASEIHTSFLLGAALFVFLNGFFDAVDGKVAKMTNTSSPFGDFLDHALDRYSDVFIVGGLALSAWCRPAVGLLAIIGMLLTSYMGTQAQAVGYGRNYTGLLGRADRMVLLIFFPIIQYIFIHYNIHVPLGYSLLEWVLIYFAVVGNMTAVQRFISTARWFKKK